jgi:hypothetical protein
VTRENLTMIAVPVEHRTGTFGKNSRTAYGILLSVAFTFLHSSCIKNRFREMSYVPFGLSETKLSGGQNLHAFYPLIAGIAYIKRSIIVGVVSHGSKFHIYFVVLSSFQKKSLKL